MPPFSYHSPYQILLSDGKTPATAVIPEPTQRLDFHSSYLQQVRRSVPITYPEVWEVEPYSARLRWHRAYIPHYYSTRPLRYRIEMQEAGSTANDWNPVATGIDKTEHTVNNVSPKKDYNFRIRAELENGDFSEPTPPIQYYRTKSDEETKVDDDESISKELSGIETVKEDKSKDTAVNGSELIDKDLDRPLSKDRPSIDSLEKDYDRSLSNDSYDNDDMMDDNDPPKPKKKSRFLKSIQQRVEEKMKKEQLAGSEDKTEDNDRPKPKRRSRFLKSDSEQDLDRPTSYGNDELSKDYERPRRRSRYGSEVLKGYDELFSRERYGNEDELKYEFERPLSKDLYGTDDLLKDIDLPKRRSRYGSDDLTEDLDRPSRRSRYGSDDLTEDLDIPKRRSRYGNDDLTEDLDKPKRKSRYGSNDLSEDFDRPLPKDRYGKNESADDFDRPLSKDRYANDDVFKDYDPPKRRNRYGTDDTMKDFDRPLSKSRYGTEDLLTDLDRPKRKSWYGNDDLSPDTERPKRKSLYGNDEITSDFDRPKRKSWYGNDGNIDLSPDYDRPLPRDRYGSKETFEELDRPLSKDRYGTDDLLKDYERPVGRNRYASEDLLKDYDRPTRKDRYSTDDLLEDNDRPSYKSRYGTDNSAEDIDRPSYKSRYGTENLTEDTDRPSYSSRKGTENSTEVPMRRGSTSLAVYQPIELDATTMNRPYIDRLTKYVPPRMPIDKPDMVVLSPESVEMAWKQAREVESIRDRSDLSYTIEVRNPPSFEWRELVSGLKTRNHVIDNLHPRIDYVFRVKAWNLYGESEPSLPVSLYRPRDHYTDEEDDEEWEREFEARFGCQEEYEYEYEEEPPIEQVPPKLPMDTPEIVTQTPDSIWFEWQAARIPAYATKTAITYVIEIKEPPSTGWRRDVSGLVDTKYVREGLDLTQDYHIRVRAESEFGISEPTLAIIIQRPRGPRPGSRLSSMERDEVALSTSCIENITSGVPPRMSATRPISINSRPDGLTLTWNACRIPSYVKRSSVAYIIEKREPPGHIWSPFAKDIKETKYNINGLDPNQDYMFRVRARNDYGTSDPSLPLTIYRERDDYVPQRIRSRSGSRDSIQVMLNRRRSISVDYASSVKSEEDAEVDATLPDKTPFQPEYVTTTYDTQYGVEGRKGKISLKVKAHPMPTVHWYFGEEKIKYGDKYNTYITPQGQINLEINSVGPDCVGEYKCCAENSSGAAVKVVKFLLAEPPTVLEPLEDRLVNAYQNITLKCRVDIPLESTIKWLKDWRPLADSAHVQSTHTKPDIYTLEITNAVPSDSGVYCCLVENQAGKVTLTSRLTIEEDVPVIPEVNLRTAAIEDYYHILEEIGRGQHGVVRRVVEISTGKSYAANFMYMRNRAQKNFFLSEFESLRSIIHVDGVLHLHDAFETDRSLIFVTEILTGPELLPQMVADGNWTEAKVASVVKKLLTIVKEIHAADILHLDIKPSNIRLCGPENTDIKLINFALSRFLHPEEDITHNYGTVGYASPEQITNDVVNCKTDMWAVGVLAYVLLSGKMPFPGETDVDILKSSMEGTWSFEEKLFDNMSPEAKDFIIKLLIKNKKERMSIDHCLDHPWLSTQSTTAINTDNIKQYYEMDKLRRDARKLYTTAQLQSLMKIQHGTAALYQPAIDVDSGEIIFPDSDDYGDYLDEDAWLEWQLQYQDDPDSQEFKIQDKKFTVRESKHTAAGPRPKEEKDKEPECDSLCFVNKIQTTSFEVGDDIVMTCSVVSKKEPPVVTWYRDETLLNEVYRTESDFDEQTGVAVLTITNAKDYDTGVYKCVARNKDGRVTCQARLLLGEKPGQPGRPVITQLSGTEALLTWMGPLTDGNSYILGYRIDYRKQGETTWTRGPFVTEEYGIVSGLVHNTGYVFRTSCHNKYGTSPYSCASLEAVAKDPDAPKVCVGIELQPLMQFTTFSKQQLILPAESRRPSLTEQTEEAKLQQTSPEDSFDIGDVLSKGSYGEYKKCTEKSNNTPYVMKIVPYSEEKHGSATREFEFLRKLHQSHIIAVSDSYIHQDSFYIVFEHLSGMNILQYLCLRKSYRETLVAHVVGQILDALQYLHHLDIAHCNLQPSSIVMATLRRPYVKLRDFTYAQNIVTSQQKLPMAGYPDFIAPEVIRNDPAGFCPDMWALGTLTFILLSGVSPFAGNTLKDTLSNILFDRFCMSDLYDNVTKDSIKFVSKLLKRLPKNRATTGQCLRSRWLQLTDSMLKAKNNASFSTERLRDYSKVYLQRRYDQDYMNLADVVITELPRPTTGPAVQPILSDRVVNRHVVNIRVSKSKSKSASPVKQVKKTKVDASKQEYHEDIFNENFDEIKHKKTESLVPGLSKCDKINIEEEKYSHTHEDMYESSASKDTTMPSKADTANIKISKSSAVDGKYEKEEHPLTKVKKVTSTKDDKQEGNNTEEKPYFSKQTEENKTKKCFSSGKEGESNAEKTQLLSDRISKDERAEEEKLSSEHVQTVEQTSVSTLEGQNTKSVDKNILENQSQSTKAKEKTLPVTKDQEGELSGKPLSKTDGKDNTSTDKNFPEKQKPNQEETEKVKHSLETKQQEKISKEKQKHSTEENSSPKKQEEKSKKESKSSHEHQEQKNKCDEKPLPEKKEKKKTGKKSKENDKNTKETSEPKKKDKSKKVEKQKHQEQKNKNEDKAKIKQQAEPVLDKPLAEGQETDSNAKEILEAQEKVNECKNKETLKTEDKVSEKLEQEDKKLKSNTEEITTSKTQEKESNNQDTLKEGAHQNETENKTPDKQINTDTSLPEIQKSENNTEEITTSKTQDKDSNNQDKLKEKAQQNKTENKTSDNQINADKSLPGIQKSESNTEEITSSKTQANESNNQDSLKEQAQQNETESKTSDNQIHTDKPLAEINKSENNTKEIIKAKSEDMESKNAVMLKEQEQQKETDERFTEVQKSEKDDKEISTLKTEDKACKNTNTLKDQEQQNENEDKDSENQKQIDKSLLETKKTENKTKEMSSTITQDNQSENTGLLNEQNCKNESEDITSEENEQTNKQLENSLPLIQESISDTNVTPLLQAKDAESNITNKEKNQQENIEDQTFKKEEETNKQLDISTPKEQKSENNDEEISAVVPPDISGKIDDKSEEHAPKAETEEKPSIKEEVEELITAKKPVIDMQEDFNDTMIKDLSNKQDTTESSKIDNPIELLNKTREENCKVEKQAIDGSQISDLKTDDSPVPDIKIESSTQECKSEGIEEAVKIDENINLQQEDMLSESKQVGDMSNIEMGQSNNKKSEFDKLETVQSTESIEEETEVSDIRPIEQQDIDVPIVDLSEKRVSEIESNKTVSSKLLAENALTDEVKENLYNQQHQVSEEQTEQLKPVDEVVDDLCKEGHLEDKLNTPSSFEQDGNNLNDKDVKECFNEENTMTEQLESEVVDENVLLKDENDTKSLEEGKVNAEDIAEKLADHVDKQSKTTATIDNSENSFLNKGIEEISTKTVQTAMQESLMQLKDEFSSRKSIPSDLDTANLDPNGVCGTSQFPNSSGKIDTEKEDDISRKEEDKLSSSKCTDSTYNEPKEEKSEESESEEKCENKVISEKENNICDKNAIPESCLPVEEEIITASLKDTVECTNASIDKLSETMSKNKVDKLAERKASEITKEVIEDLATILKKTENNSQNNEKETEESTIIPIKEDTIASSMEKCVESTGRCDAANNQVLNPDDINIQSTEENKNFEKTNVENGSDENEKENYSKLSDDIECPEGIQKDIGLSDIVESDNTHEAQADDEHANDSKCIKDANSDFKNVEDNKIESENTEENENVGTIDNGKHKSDSGISIKEPNTDEKEQIQTQGIEQCKEAAESNQSPNKSVVSGDDSKSTSESGKEIEKEDEEPNEEDIARQMAERAILEDAMLFC